MRSKAEARWLTTTIVHPRKSRRRRRDLPSAGVEIALELRALSLWYGSAASARGGQLRRAGAQDHGADRAERVGQVEPAALPQPAQRRVAGMPRRRRGAARRHEHLCEGRRRARAAPARRHGVPEAESVSAVGLRERRVRPAPARRQAAARARCVGRDGAEGRDALGRGRPRASTTARSRSRSASSSGS